MAGRRGYRFVAIFTSRPRLLSLQLSLMTSNRAPNWKRHLRDPDVWQAFGIASLTLIGTAGLAWLVHFRRTWKVAGSAPVQPSAGCHLLLFGKKLRDGVADRDLIDRIARAHALIQEGRVRALILLGGSNDGGPTEAAVAQELLLELGVPDGFPIILDEASGDTLENLRHARSLLAALAEAPIVLLSNRYHLARCALLAHSIGLQHELCAAESETRLQRGHWISTIKEASLSLWLDAGIRWARLIGHRRMLSKLA